MFKLGIKKILFALSLIIFSSCVFIGCDEKKVEVNSISFKETESITMIVGQEYEPNVAVLPSYADNRNYYFEIGSNPDVLKISNKKITAMKSGVCQLKVVSQDNDYLTDMISIKVLDEAVQLSAPQNLVFYDNAFSFDPVKNAESYTILVNGAEFNIGNSTKFSLTQYEQLSNLSAYNTLLDVKVKANGDGVVSLSSQYSDSFKQIKISSVENLKIKQNALMFDKVLNVGSYSIKFSNEKETVLSMDIDSADFNGDVIEIGLAKYLSHLNSGEYYCEVLASSNNYEIKTTENVSASAPSVVKFDSLAKPSNISFNAYTLHWDKVLNAEYYSILDESGNIIKDNIETNSFDLTKLNLSATSYSYKLVANTISDLNVLTGLNYSDVISFKILEKPNSSIQNKVISWGTITDATAYQVVITNQQGDVVQNSVVANNSYSISQLPAGNYEYKVKTLGNGKNTLASLDSSYGNFKFLNSVLDFKIENKVVSWQSTESNLFNLTILDESNNEILNTNLTSTSYDVSSIILNSGKYQAKVVCLGDENSFDSAESVLNFHKLKDAQNIELNGGVLTFQADSKSSSTDVRYFHTNAPSQIKYMNKIGASSYSLDTESLAPGEHKVLVFVYGNGKEILDADNLASYTIRKLEAPTLSVDKVEEAVVRIDDVNYADGYEITENGTTIANLKANEYSYSFKTISAGSYEYKIKAVGNGKENIDSDYSTETIKVLKLSTPGLTFDKSSLSYTISTEQDEYISKYNFKINGEPVELNGKSKVVDCSDSTKYFLTAGSYQAVVKLEPNTSSDYNYIMQSDIQTVVINKLDGISTFEFIDGNIVITPTKIESLDESYSATLKIGYLNNGVLEYVDYNALNLVENKYSVKIIDNYEIIGPTKPNGNALFEDAGNYILKLIIDKNQHDCLPTSIVDLGVLTKLEKVSNISKDSEAIKYNLVENASQYLLIIEDNGTKYYLENKTNSISISDLKTKFAGLGLNLQDGNNYELTIVAIGNEDNKFVSSISTEVFNFKLLATPTASITLDDDNEKVVSIRNNVLGATGYEVVFTDSDSKIFKTNVDVSASESTNIKLSEVTGLSSGEISISITATSSLSNAFASSNISLAYTQLETPVLEVKEGKLSWQINPNASYYILSYYSSNEWIKVNLNNTNYDVVDNYASYDFKTVPSGYINFKLQAISNLTEGDKFYFDSQESLTKNTTKLSKPTVNYNNGEINLNFIASEVDYIDSVIISTQTKNVNLLDLVDEITANSVISPEKLLSYISADAIEEERFSVVIYAKDSTDYLDSNSFEFGAKGIKPVKDLTVKTSVNYEASVGENPETLDKISWSIGELNQGLIRGYIININYKDKDYQYKIDDGNAEFYTFPDEEYFGSGVYTIKVKALAISSENYVNADYSAEFVMTVCETVKDIRTEKGVLNWEPIVGAENYIVRIFDNGEFKTYYKTRTNSFDFSVLSRDYTAKYYTTTIQAINEESDIVASSEESAEFQVVRLPEITKYRLSMGDLYVYAHSFTSQIKVILTAQDMPGCEFVADIESSVGSIKDQYTNWENVSNLDVLLANDENSNSKYKFDYYKLEFKYSDEEKTTILNCLSKGYSIQFEAIGNSASFFSTVNSYITSSTNNSELINENFNTTTLTKTLTPNVSLADRGVLVWELENTTYSQMNYDGLKDLLLFKVRISTKAVNHEFYVVDYLDMDNLPLDVEVYEFDELENHTYYGYLKYNDIYINILDFSQGGGKVGSRELNFNQNNLYYVNYKTGAVETINLIDGGNFDVSINVLGDDTRYLTSNNSKSLQVVRYAQLALSVSDGYLKWKNQKTESDNPIYLLKITASDNTQSYVYLYDENLPYSINSETPEVLENGRNYTHAMNFSTEYINYLFDTVDENGNNLFTEDSYSVSLITYYRSSTELDVLNSKASPQYQTTKLNNTTLSLNNGSLSWNEVSIPTLSSTKVKNYEIIVEYQGDEYVFRIYPNNYKVVDGKVIYTLVETVQCVDGSEFKFVQGETYTFSVRALAGEYIDYISSNKSNSVQTAISTGIYNVAMNNGVLVWESDYVDGLYEILITYTTTGGEIVKIKTTTYLKEFALPLNMTDIEGDGRTLTSIYKYSIQVRKLGSSAVLSSFYTTNFDVEKLKTVELTNVYAVDGAIEFVNLKNLADEDIENVIYTLIFENIDHEDVKVANNSFDFENFDAGEIKFRIIAEHNDYFASELSEIKTIYKLGIITNFQPIQVNGIYNSLSWSSVKVNNVFADRYEIEFYDTINDISSIAEAVPKNPEDETIVFNLEGIEISNMEIRIRAVSSNSSVVKGSWSERYSLTMAEKINKDHFGVNGLNFEWRQIENETIFDEYILQYTYRETEGQAGYKTESIKVTDYYTITEGEQTIKVYYYTPFAVGIYENISVSVNRLDSLSSNSVIMQTNGVNTKYVFDKFASGDGITKPYQINSFEHLQNINLFKSANYILTADIDLEDITSSLMEGEFTGTFDGQNNSLGHYTQTTETNYTGIFEQSNGAIIKNLTITYANVYINTDYNNAKIYGGIVVGNAINTTFENVNISYSTLNINILDNLSSSSDNINSKFYFGGVSGCLTNSNVINCDISLGYINEKTETVYNNIIFSGWSRDQVYYGAISGYVLNSSICGNENDIAKVELYYETNISISSGHSTYPELHIGGAVGKFEVSSTTEITHYMRYLDVKVYQSNTYFGEVYANGAVCGYLHSGEISNVSVTGNIGANANSSIINSIYIGKLVAKSELNVILLNNNVSSVVIVSGSNVVVNETINL